MQHDIQKSGYKTSGTDPFAKHGGKGAYYGEFNRYVAMNDLKTTPPQAAKQVLVIRKDLGMRKGKLGAQSAHASMGAVFPRESACVEPQESGLFRISWVLDAIQLAWFMDLSTKIVVSVNSEEELMSVYQKAVAAGLPCVLIQDRGFTEFGGVPTYTAVGIGPAPQSSIDAITGQLPLL